MFPRLFRSRWSALYWSAGILWTAYDVAGSAPIATNQVGSTDVTGENYSATDLANLANAVGE